MRRDLASGVSRPMIARCTRSIACLAFVLLLASAFWAGAVWIVRALMALSAPGF